MQKSSSISLPFCANSVRSLDKFQLHSWKEQKRILPRIIVEERLLQLCRSSRGGSGNRHINKASIEVHVTLEPGTNRIDLLSATMGLKNYGAFYDLAGAGITGPVQLKRLSKGSTIDLSL